MMRQMSMLKAMKPLGIVSTTGTIHAIVPVQIEQPSTNELPNSNYETVSGLPDKITISK
jgi:hypothetical protein